MYVKPKEACKHYNVSEQALRCWARDGKLKYFTTEGGHRRYLINTQQSQPTTETKSVIYARVSSGKQKADLERQAEYLRERYPNHLLITDIGSGINFKRKGLKAILEGVFNGTIKEVVVAQRDRFTRFGFELFEWIFESHGATLVCIDSQEDHSPSEELGEDLMAIITVFTSRYYGRRKYPLANLLS